MPPAISDSDDEGVDDLSMEAPDMDPPPHTASRGTGQGTAGNDEQSTGSTERLANEIHSAERVLFAKRTEQTATNATNVRSQFSAASPVEQRRKRRSVSVGDQESSLRPPKRGKRSQTVKTYGSKQTAPRLRDEDGMASFDAMMQSERSQESGAAAPFSDRSDVQTSNDLPNHTLQDDFADHEPVAMFKDSAGSGSTVPDNSSCIHQCIEKLGQGDRPQTTGRTEPETQETSSIPTSAFEYTQPSESNREQTEHEEGHHCAVKDPSSNDQGTASNTAQQSTEAGHVFAQTSAVRPLNGHPDTSPPIQEAHAATTDADPGHGEVMPSPIKPRSSPIVRIRPQEIEDKHSQATESGTARKTRGRKRQAEEEMSEPLNSEDMAVGLPKERYNPRPSRRRATAALEHDIDYSVVPEKAAKTRRTKTTDPSTAPHSTKETPISDNNQPLALLQVQDTRGSQESTNEVEAAAEPQAENTSYPNVSSLPKTSQDGQVGAKTKPSQEVPGAFKKPAAKAKPKPKASTRAKRSHTTIFEDHVEFSGTQRSQSLRQQQELRVSALRDVSKENSPRPAQTAQRRSRVIASSDDEDGEEITVKSTIDNAPVPEPEGAPQKPALARCRKGQPPKSTAKPSATSEPMNAHHATEREDEMAVEDNADKGSCESRARVSAASPTVEIPTTESGLGMLEQAGPNDEPGQPSQGTAKCGIGEPQQVENGGSPNLFKASIPTPSPRNVDKEALTPKQKVSKTEAASHSPIKSSSKVPYRVGLSKKQKIAPLLRMTKPATR
ncbi:hypothetical protein MBLNU230_g1781t1 [Neophaeotheca triangularis]